jgi:tRNA(Ile)-lysidine synthase
MAMGNHSAVDAKEFAACMQALLPHPPASLAIAVSGGADSMALCLLTAQWAKQHNVALHALTVDHGLRPEAADEAMQVKAWLDARDIPHHILPWRDEKPGANIQAAARHARYNLLGEWCAAKGIRHILLAHHRDDQAETFLIRLGRGSGVDGLSAMRPISTRQGLTLLRPLLGIEKTRLIATLEAAKQRWIEDPSNHKPEFTRTRMRLLAPVLEDAGITAQDIAATADRMARARDYLETQTRTAYAACVQEHDYGSMTLDASALHDLHPEIGLRVLADVLRRMNGSYLRPRFSELEALYAALGDSRTLSGCRFIPTASQVRVEREAAALAAPQTISAGQSLLWDGRFAVHLSADCPLQELSVGALGEAGYAIIKPQLPPKAPGRDFARLLPSLWHLEKPLLVPHMNYAAPAAQAVWMRVESFPEGGECY